MNPNGNPYLQKLKRNPNYTDNIEHAQPHDHVTYRDLSEGPIDIEMGGTRLKVIKPERDIIDAKKAEWTHFNPNIPYYLIDPENLDFKNDKGYKALRDDESIILGREDEYAGRFDFTSAVSRKQVQLLRSGDRLFVEDLGSTNGTYIGRSVLRGFGIEEPRMRNVPKQNKVASPQAQAFAEYEGGERLSVKMEVSSLANERHPERNEDNKFIDTVAGSAGVFDGVGGDFGSEVASAVAAQSVRESLRNTPDTLSIVDGKTIVENALRKAHADIIAEAAGVRRISTTATIAKLLKNEHGQPYVAIASVADSRAYLLRDGQLSMLTLDETLAAALVQSQSDKKAQQEKFSNTTRKSELSEEEYANFKRQSMITSLLGSGGEGELYDVQTTHVEIQSGDKILLTSDGVHDNLTTKEIQAIMTSASSDTTSELTSAAQRRSREPHIRAKADDMTAAIMSFDTL